MLCPRSSPWTVGRLVFLPSLLRDASVWQVPSPWSPSPSPVSFTSSPAPLLPTGTCLGAGRKVRSGAQGVGGEAGTGVSGRREQAGTCHLSKLIPRATSKSHPSCPARSSPFFPPTPLPGMTQSWVVLAFVWGTPDWLNQLVVDDSLGTFWPLLCSRSVCFWGCAVAAILHRCRPQNPCHTPGVYKSSLCSSLRVILGMLVTPTLLSQGFLITQTEWQR